MIESSPLLGKLAQATRMVDGVSPKYVLTAHPGMHNIEVHWALGKLGHAWGQEQWCSCPIHRRFDPIVQLEFHAPGSLRVNYLVQAPKATKL